MSARALRDTISLAIFGNWLFVEPLMCRPMHHQHVSVWHCVPLLSQFVSLVTMCHKPVMPVSSASSTVLVVDDLPLNRKLLSALAQKLGFATKEAVNGAEALAMLAQHQQHQTISSNSGTRNSSCTSSSDSPRGIGQDIACVLLDLQMPVLDGWSTARGVRELKGDVGSVPIIACTAADLASATAAGLTMEQETLASGIDLCLNKPLKLEQLVAALEQLSVPCPVGGSLSRSSSASSIRL